MMARSFALAAMLGCCAAAHGQILVGSVLDNTIRSFGTNGTQNTPFATGQATPTGIAVAPDNTLYVSNQATSTISHLSAGGVLLGSFALPSSVENIGGTPTLVPYSPAGLTVGANGDLYITRYGNSQPLTISNNPIGRVDRYTTGGTFVSTIASGLVGPSAVQFIGNNLFISVLGDSTNGQILRSVGGAAPTVFVPYAAGTGGLVAPQGLTVGPDGNLYVADQFGGAVRRYNPTTGANVDADQAFVDPTDPSGIGGLFPSGVVFNGGSLYVSLLGSAFAPPSGPNGGLRRFNGTTGVFDNTFTPTNNFAASTVAVAPVPEPASLALLGGAGLTLAARLRRRK